MNKFIETVQNESIKRINDIQNENEIKEKEEEDYDHVSNFRKQHSIPSSSSSSLYSSSIIHEIPSKSDISYSLFIIYLLSNQKSKIKNQKSKIFHFNKII